MHVSGLFVYPIKSCAGTAVAEWELDRNGLAHDRSFMVVDPEGRFLTQREQPALALVRPELHGDELVVHVPDRGSVTLPLSPTGPVRTVTVWEHTGPAIDTGDQVAELLSDHLHTPVRLVALPPDHERPVDPDYAPGHTVGFSDGFPLLLVAQASLDDLNSRLAQPLPMNRFRPNVVVDGARPFAEDGWRRLIIGEVPVDVVKPCARCTITTVDQTRGARAGAEPLRTLGTFRRGTRGVTFGYNAVHAHPGRWAVGDPVTVTQTTAQHSG